MFEVLIPMRMYCDNQVVIHIAFNPMFHESTKHIKVALRLIVISFVRRLTRE